MEQNIGNTGTKQLAINRILCRPKQGCGIQMLLEPTEKKLHLPSGAVQISNPLGIYHDQIRHDVDGLSLITVKGNDPKRTGGPLKSGPNVLKYRGILVGWST